jgi:hypothetical protein
MIPKLSETFRFRPRTADDEARDDELERNGAVEELAGGLAYGQGDDQFDAKALNAGTKVELEHTDDASLAKQIAKDHLSEDPKYYEKLKKMEQEGMEFDVTMAAADEPCGSGEKEQLVPEDLSKMFGWIERAINEVKRELEEVEIENKEAIYGLLDGLADHTTEIFRHIVDGDQMKRWVRDDEDAAYPRDLSSYLDGSSVEKRND